MRPDKHIGTVIGGYALEAMIGWGKSSKVYRARHQLTGHVQAIKVITKAQSHVGVLHQSLPECTVMGKLKHPNIVELNQWFETEKRVYLIMELAKDGDVLSILNRAQRPLPEETVQNWFAQLIDALSFAHARNFVHGDLRLENILIDGNRVLLADWGSAHTFYAGVPCADSKTRALAYSAPEILARRPYLASQAECWALGVVLYALACGKLPFDRTAPDFASDVATANFPMPSHVSVRLRSMIHGLLSIDPIIRFSLFDVQHHDFFMSSRSNVFSMPVCGALRSSASAPLASIAGSNKYNPAPRGNSGSDVARRNTAPIPAAAVHMRVHELRDSPPRSPSFSRSGSAVRLRREPPSPAQSEPSSRISVRHQDENDSDVSTSAVGDRGHAARDDQTQAQMQAPRGQGSPERKPKKPLSRVFAFIKHLPSRVLGGSNNASAPS